MLFAATEIACRLYIDQVNGNTVINSKEILLLTTEGEGVF